MGRERVGDEVGNDHHGEWIHDSSSGGSGVREANMQEKTKGGGEEGNTEVGRERVGDDDPARMDPELRALPPYEEGSYLRLIDCCITQL